MDKLIQNFSIKSVADFFKNKISSFSPNSENLDYILKDADFAHFSDLQKIGEVEFNNSDELIVFTCKFQGVLSERSSKKRQFEIAKKILKEDFKDGAIFIFYDDNDCFRFSFIRKNYGNKDQKFTNWKRYTYFVDPARTNKTFKNRINGCNFSSLEDIQEAFSVEKLNKKFYEEIATAFYSLIGGKVSINKKEVSFDAKLQLPSTPVENRKVYQEFAVRLIGRTIFCWFLKNKKSDSGVPLIPEEWLSSNMVASVNNDQHNYYHSILEKLFFLVLNKKHEDRKPYVLPNNHEFVPFLNGGLFEAQDDDFFPKDSKGIHSQNFALNIPNQWFRDFFETLEQYNFTIDENSINDFEVSIDPEMLGTIFENLLAEIDPDTEKSARKSTGSFYTPREIVDYMVEQSLLQYIKTKTNIEDEEQLEVLLKDDTENPFDEKQTITILEALSEVKILDPACGSGAFPMGVLHKIIGLLKKLDKNAVWWKAKQLEKIDNALVRKTMETKLNQANSDYIRKLGVIQHSIYGVDIQPIAAEISKLRSFLSLIIDENIDDKAENRGIEPLPNLEFKFVTANTLIGLEAEIQNSQLSMDMGQTSDIQNDLQKIRNAYLQATPDEKIALKKGFEKLQKQLILKDHKHLSKRDIQLAGWKPFSNDSSEWFDPEWMFGVNNFDIVIGNPPYVSVKSISAALKKYFADNYKTGKGRLNLYTLFIENGYNRLKTNGVLSYIIPDNLYSNIEYRFAREILVNKTTINKICLFSKRVFEAAVDTAVIVFSKTKNENNIIKVEKDLKETFNNLPQSQISNYPFYLIAIKSLPINLKLVEKLMFNNESVKLGKLLEIQQGIIYSGQAKEDVFSNEIVNKTYKKCLDGRDVLRYKINWNEKLDCKYISYTNKLHRPREERLFLNEKKILMPRRATKLYGSIDYEQFYALNTAYILLNKNSCTIDLEFFLALLNSKLFNFVYNQLYFGWQITIPALENLPVIIPSDNVQKIISDKVKKIIKVRVDENDVNELNLDIDIYKLYELTYDEVLVVEPEFSLSKQEYEAFTV